MLQNTPLMARHSNSSSSNDVLAQFKPGNQRHSGVSWVRVRVFELSSVSMGPSASILPTFVSLLQSGLLVVGLGSELQVFSQWQGSSKSSATHPPALPPPPPEDNQIPEERPSLTITETQSGRESRRQSLTQQVMSPSEQSRSLADNVWLSVSSASFLQMHRTASFQSLAKHTGGETMAHSPTSPHHTNSLLHHHHRHSADQKNQPALRKRSDSLDQARAAIRVLEDASLYELALATNPVLPQYHPKFLLELLKIGKVATVDEILAHVVKSVFPDIKMANKDDTVDEEFDVSAAEDEAADRLVGLSKQQQKQQQLPGIEIGNIENDESISATVDDTLFVRPIPLHILWKMLTSSSSSKSQNSKPKTAADLMAQLSITSSDSSDALMSRPRLNSTSVGNEPVFSEKMARLLSVLLSKSRLPGLSNLDQVYLLALAGLVSSRNKMSDPSSQLYSESLDACGSRFLLDMRHHHYLAQTLPMAHRSKIIQKGLSSTSYLWAFHSESQEELLSMIPCMQKGEPNWKELRSYGVGYWLRSITSLRKLVEQLARSSFQKTRDPLDSALFYLAMKKKSVLAVLFKSHENVRMRDFFKNDFSEERWRKAALKNAFDLLAKQRFEHAIAFFLLADSLRDAIEVCVSRLFDVQLALVIARLHDDSQTFYQQLMKSEILGSLGNKRRSSDSFLLSLAHWVLGEHQMALDVLLDSSTSGQHSDDFGHMTAVFGFYCHLKGHPLMRKLTSQTGHSESAHLERQTHFLTAHNYFKAGCPLLALNVLARMPLIEHVCNKQKDSTKSPEPEIMKRNNKTPEVSVSVDWSQPVTNTESDELVLDWSDEDEEEEDDEEKKVEEDKKEEVEVKKNEDLLSTPVSFQPKKESSPGLSSSQNLTCCPSSADYATSCVAEQLKFTCCLRLLADELTALCGGQTSSQLHQLLFTWLQNELHLVSTLVLAMTGESLNSTEIISGTDGQQCPAIKNVDVAQLLDSISERKQWLVKHSHLLHCLLNFTSLLAPTSTPLALAMNELCQLSQDLYSPKSQLSCKLPTSVSLPLVQSALSPIRACFQNVVSIIHGLASDILNYLASVDRVWPPTPRLLSRLRASRDLALTLSSCVYQSLCGSDLDPGRLRVVTTEPTKWPGVGQWSALLSQYADPDCPRLYLLLTRCLMAVHSALFAFAMANSDPRTLYRLIANPLNLSAWNRVFGGAKRMPVRQHAPSQPPQPQSVVREQPQQVPGGLEIDKHRSAMNRRVLEQRRGSEDKIVYTEEFIPPTTTLASYFMRKPEQLQNLDTETSEILNMDDTHDLEDDRGSDNFNDDNTEHEDEGSRSWLLMRIALLEQVAAMYRQFLPSLGVEHQDIVQSFPMVHGLLAAMSRWHESATMDLAAVGPPPPAPDFVPDRSIVEPPSATAPAFDKYIALIKPDNTPFMDENCTILHRRLWIFLVRQEALKPLFVKHIFGPTALPSGLTLDPDSFQPGEEQENKSKASKARDADKPEISVKMIHKDQEAVGAFCINQNNLNCVALALSKEILQLDIGAMLRPPTWVESDLDYDIETMMNPKPADACNLFTVVSSSGSMASLASQATNASLPPSAPGVIPSAINNASTSALTAYGATMVGFTCLIYLFYKFYNLFGYVNLIVCVNFCS